MWMMGLLDVEPTPAPQLEAVRRHPPDDLPILRIEISHYIETKNIACRLPTLVSNLDALVLWIVT
jgi:hypothetical protein